MFKQSISVLIMVSFVFVGCGNNENKTKSVVQVAPVVAKGKLRVASDRDDITIFVNGKKKASGGKEYTTMILPEGDYTVRVYKPIDDEWFYEGTKKVFVGGDTSSKVTIDAVKKATQKRLDRLAKEKREKEEKLAREKKQLSKKYPRITKNSIKDTKTGLIWQDDSAAKSVKKTFKEAKTYCSKLKLDGKNSWRLPTYDELLGLVDYNYYNPAIIPVFKNVSSSGYWSSSVDVSNSSNAWLVGFYYGSTGNDYKSNSYYVRCVRGRQ